MKKIVLNVGMFLFISAIIGFVAVGCSSDSNNDSNGNNNTDGDIVDTVDNSSESDLNVSDGDEESVEFDVIEEQTTDGDVETNENTETSDTPAEVADEEVEPPCGGSCPDNTICHEELNGGTCLPNCNDGDGTNIGDDFCYAQDVGIGYSRYDFYCRPDGQCVLNDFGATCKDESENIDSNSDLDCDSLCSKVEQCIPDTNCQQQCSIGSHEFNADFSSAFSSCVASANDCGPSEYNNQIDVYCFMQVLNNMNVPAYVTDGCSTLRTWLSESCNLSDDDINARVKNCEMWGLSMKHELFQNIIECASGYCEDFDKCLAQSNCLYSRQF